MKLTFWTLAFLSCILQSALCQGIFTILSCHFKVCVTALDERDILLVPVSGEYGMLVVDLKEPSRQCKPRGVEGLSEPDVYLHLLLSYLQDADDVKGCFEQECSVFNKERDIWEPAGSSPVES